MIRGIFSFIAIAALLSSCGNSGNKEVSLKNGGSEESIKVEFASLIENPDGYVNKNISVEGKVVHVCPHTGKKMFIVGDNPDIRLYIEAGEETPKFPMELLGSVITVEGNLVKLSTPDKPGETERMGNAQMEEGMKKEGEPGTAMIDGELCETEAAVAAQPVLADLTLTYKSHIVK